MGWFSDVGSFVSSVGSAISSGVRTAIGAMKSVGSSIIRGAKSALNYVTSKVTDWKKLLLRTAEGALKGGIAGFKMEGFWGAIVGGLKGGAVYGYKEWKRQAREKEQIEEDQQRIGDAQEMDAFSQDVELKNLFEAMSRFIPKLTRQVSNDAPVESFDEYLRIDIAMTFIRDLVGKLEKIQDPSEITAADRRMIVLIDKLVMDSELTDIELQEFDDLIKKRYGKSLFLMGSERLFVFWNNEEEEVRDAVELKRRNLTRIELRISELKNRADYALDLAQQEQVELEKAQKDAALTKGEYENAKNYHRNLRFISGAAEGLLQQAEADDMGMEISDRQRKRNDKTGVIMVNLQRDIDDIRSTGEIRLNAADAQHMQLYVDSHMAEASARKKKLKEEYANQVEVGVAG